MSTIVRKEVRKRGFFGWLFLLLFLTFNVLMVFWLIGYWSHLKPGIESSDGVEAAGTAIGGAIGTGALFMVWVVGGMFTGILALLTRGRKTIITETAS